MARTIQLYNTKVNSAPRDKFEFDQLAQFASVEERIRVALEASTLGRYSFTATDIRSALDNQDISTLRRMSNYFYYNSGAYRRLVEYFGGILTNDYLVIPHISEEDVDNKALQKSLDTVAEYLRASNTKETCSMISRAVVKDGAFYGYEREIDKSYTLQQLPAERCRSRFKIDNMYAVEFDFAFFDQFRAEEKEEMLSAFPEEFRAMHDAYLGDRTNFRWQLLDPEFSRAHMLQSQVPILAPVFTDLLELEDYKSIDKARSSLDIYKLLVQRIPTNKDGEIDLYMEEIKDLHNNARQMVTNSNIDVITTPCDFKEINLTDRATQARDDVQKATNAIYSTAGTSTVLFSDGARSTNTGLTTSVKVDEALMFPLLAQYETWYNHKLSTVVGGKIQFSIAFPPISQYNKQDMLDLYTKGATLGFPTKLLTMAALGLNQFNMEHLLTLENTFLKLHERMIPTSSSYNTGVMDPSNQGGRPESEEPLSDEGEATREGDKNDLGE